MKTATLAVIRGCSWLLMRTPTKIRRRGWKMLLLQRKVFVLFFISVFATAPMIYTRRQQHPSLLDNDVRLNRLFAHDPLTQSCRLFASRDVSFENRDAYIREFANSDCGDLWNGESRRAAAFGNSTLSIEVVVAFCLEPLDWLWEQLGELSHHKLRISVFSKCGGSDILVDATRKTNLPIRIIELENVGGCDHTYAHWLAKYSRESHADFVLFLKDTERRNELLRIYGSYRSMTDMIRIASIKGFSCGLSSTAPLGKAWYLLGEGEFACELASVYHDREVLFSFNLKRWNYVRASKTGSTLGNEGKEPFHSPKWRNLGHFWEQGLAAHLEDKEIPRFTPVCYGGTFAVSMRNVIDLDPSVAKNLELELSRSNNIEEGHWAERLWATLLSKKTSALEAIALEAFADRVRDESIAVHGALSRRLFEPVFIRGVLTYILSFFV